jgi:hypothetical protein
VTEVYHIWFMCQLGGLDVTLVVTRLLKYVEGA